MIKLIKQIWKSRYTILRSFWNKYFKYSKNRDVAMERLDICRSCPASSYNLSNPNYEPGEYQDLPYEHCTRCGCSIFLKIYSTWEDPINNPLYNPCPLKKWIK